MQDGTHVAAKSQINGGATVGGQGRGVPDVHHQLIKIQRDIINKNVNVLFWGEGVHFLFFFKGRHRKTRETRGAPNPFARKDAGLNSQLSQTNWSSAGPHVGDAGNILVSLQSCQTLKLCQTCCSQNWTVWSNDLLREEMLVACKV